MFFESLAKSKYFVPLLLGIILLVGFISYINVYTCQFLWDDEFLIQNNKLIKSFSSIPEIFRTCSGAGAGRLDDFYRPMQQLAYNFIYHLGGLNPWPFHLLNVLLHLVNALLIFVLVRKLFKKELLAFLASLLWVVHPVHTEAVSYISGTADPLAAFFMLASFWTYIFFREKDSFFLFALSNLLFISALLSKETSIILPVLFLLYEFLFAEKRFELKNYLWTIPFFVFAAIYFGLRVTVLNFGGTLNFYKEANIYTDNIFIRLITFAATLPVYYSFLVYPFDLHFERTFPIFDRIFPGSISLFSLLPLFSILILLFLAYAFYLSIKEKHPLWAFGIGWFFIAFIPMSGIIPVNSLLLEHWLYFPSIGFFLLLAGGIEFLWGQEQLRAYIVGAMIVILVGLISLSLLRNTAWKDPITLYNDILKYEEGTARVHNNLAMAYDGKGDLPLAEKHYLKAIALNDTYPQTHYNLANLYLKAGLVDQAVAHLNRSIEINPNFFYAYHLLGEIYQKTGKPDLAKQYLDKANSIKYY